AHLARAWSRKVDTGFRKRSCSNAEVERDDDSRKEASGSSQGGGRSPQMKGLATGEIMRNGQNKRMRGRNNHRKSHNPMARVFESNGPEVKIRGNPSHIAEKYIQLARDAQASGDPAAAETYYQHAEHYYPVITSAQAQ